MDREDLKKRVQAQLVAAELLECDTELLQMVAEYLVRKNRQKADSLQFAINVEIHEQLVAHGLTNVEFNP